MNATLLMQVKEQILKEPNRFIMHGWVVGEKEGLKDGIYIQGFGCQFHDNTCIHDLSECGTAACIGGWACVLTNTTVYSSEQYRSKAAEILGIEDRESLSLFNVENWPIDLFIRWTATNDINERAQIAAERIDRYVDDFCPDFRKNYEEERANANTKTEAA